MGLNQVSFGGSESKGGSFFSSLKDSAINVASTVAAGTAAGALGGKIASLKPYTPNAAALDFQYADMFQKALRNETTPEYIKNAGDKFTKLVDSARACTNILDETTGKLYTGDTLLQTVKNLPEGNIAADEIQNSAKTFLKSENMDIPQGTLTKDKITQSLQKINEKLYDKIKETSKTIDGKRSEFAEKIAEAKNPRVDELANKGAKHLRNKSVIGAGIAIGVIGALVLNLLKTYGIIGKKHPKSQNAQTVEPAAVQSGDTKPASSMPANA
ncbi:MAG: hypothetical protein LUH11_03670 [Candidatus Gastranaerophilales bacterium]|nr:hypothetical protein [Candidatus Gastranaerophilales bacterium]